MTDLQKKAREIAARSPARFVEIERLTRSTAGNNARRLWAAEAKAKRDAMFAAERRRLIRSWNKA